MKKAAWYRPADTVLFVPATPGSELIRRVRMVAQEEGRRLGVSIRCVERAGLSLKQQLVRTDLSAGNPCPQGDCMLCITNPEESGGLLHHRSGTLYSASCTICPVNGFTAVYTGESGYSGYVRTGEHRTAILGRDQTNPFARHLREHHADREGDTRTFMFRVVKTFTKALIRLVSEAVKIHGCGATFILNSRAEWHQPAIERVFFTREAPGQQPQEGGRDGGRGGRRNRGGGGR